MENNSMRDALKKKKSMREKEFSLFYQIIMEMLFCGRI